MHENVDSGLIEKLIRNHRQMEESLDHMAATIHSSDRRRMLTREEFEAMQAQVAAVIEGLKETRDLVYKIQDSLSQENKEEPFRG